MNKMTHQKAARWSALGLTWALLLTACGGGGGGDAPQPPTPGPVSNCANGTPVRVEAASSAVVGANAELSALSCGETLRELSWRQTAGPALTLMSARSQALSIQPAEAGRYEFSLTYKDGLGGSHTAAVALSVAAAGSAPLQIRGEPSVWGGGSGSLRLWAPGLSKADLEGATVSWQRLDGPALTLSKTDQWAVLFTAPEVTQDAVARLRATLTLRQGTVQTQDYQLLVQKAPTLAASPAFDSSSPSSRVYPYLASGPYAAALQECIYHPGLSTQKLCNVGRLGLLGQETRGLTPTVEQVMQRVLVSNDWMGEVFERYLREQDTAGDLRRMFNATTAIVIGGRVRPAFYWAGTGAIYLDATYLWLTPEQRDTVSERPDPRSDYGQDLAYSMIWRYVQNNDYAGGRYPVDERRSRSLSDLNARLGSLLFHELSHAGDFLPPRVHGLMDIGKDVWGNRASGTASEQLAFKLPLLSQTMVQLGQVQFFGAPSTAELRALTPADVMAQFSPDRATDEYNYSLAPGQTLGREDAAMLIEEAMVQLRFGILRDVAITPLLTPTGSSADLVVHWGQRGRVGHAAIRPRVAEVMSQITPWVSASELDRLQAPQTLVSGRTWAVNLDPNALQLMRPQAWRADQRQQADEQDREAHQRKADVRRGQIMGGSLRSLAQ